MQAHLAEKGIDSITSFPDGSRLFDLLAEFTIQSSKLMVGQTQYPGRGFLIKPGLLEGTL